MTPQAVVAIVVLILLYFAPTILAAARKKRSVLSIFLTNFLFAWTIVGWLVTMIWALSIDQPAQQVVVDVAPPVA